MVRDGFFDAEFAEPTIGEVHLHVSADQPLRADGKDVPHDQHRIISSGSIDGRPIDE